MSESKDSKKGLKNWLDTIQQDSWQLELLISGFAIFLLLGARSAIYELEYDLLLLQQSAEGFFMLDGIYYVSRIAYLSLLGCLLFHVVLRGVWIAAVGLRSVSGDIDYDGFRFQRPFDGWLRSRMGTFDNYIDRLERYCSVIFTLAFLLVFCLLSLAGWFSFWMLINEAFSWVLDGAMGDVANNIFSILALVTGLVYFVDFTTLGWLKRIRWLGRPYFYLYRFMGWLTLARFYRPLYYNLIDNRFGKRLAILLPVIILLLLLANSVKQIKYAYYPYLVQSGETLISSSTYDDAYFNKKSRAWGISLKSRYVHNNYVEAFVPYIPINDDELIQQLNPTLEPSRWVGTKLEGIIDIGEQGNPKADNKALLKAMTGLRRVYLNDSLIEVRPRFRRHIERRQPGLLYLIPTHDLPNGEHWLRFDRIKMDDLESFSTGRVIYFYK